MNCKYCNSTNIVKYGTYKGIQRYYCKDCKRKFTAIDSLPKMKTPIRQVAAAMSMYYERKQKSDHPTITTVRLS